jgi:hypothetical protein
MISHNNPKFLFIHLPKNAGSSVTKVLANYIGVDREELRPQKLKFIRAVDIPNILGEGKDDYFVFSVTRNPWSRIVSYFHYLKQIKQPPGNLPANAKFDQWVKMGGFRSLQTQMSQLGDGKGVSSHIDYVAKLETIQEDWPKICEGLGIECELMHDKKSKHEHYSSYYNGITQSIIAQYYKQDIDTFGYEFETK